MQSSGISVLRPLKVPVRERRCVRWRQHISGVLPTHLYYPSAHIPLYRMYIRNLKLTCVLSYVEENVSWQEIIRVDS